MFNRSLAIVVLFCCPLVAVAAEELLTTENYAKIEKGMTKEEVKEILGAWKSSATSGKDTTLTWRRKDDGSQRIEVHFKDGKVLSSQARSRREDSIASLASRQR
jgi:outer membrane protein assembly factor BamE (lipoprotein component of BamABCDE complex)